MVRKSVAIYGAGYCGLMLTDYLKNTDKYEVKRILDRSKDKQNRIYNNINVSKPKFISGIDIVIVAILKKGKTYMDIRDNLLQLGYKDVIHVSDFMEMNDCKEKHNLIYETDIEMLNRNTENIDKVYERLGDETSKSTYRAVIKYLSDKNIEITSYPYKEQYLAYDLFTRNKKEVFLDCGAFKGEVYNYFCEQNSEFSKYIFVEPDLNYIEILREKKAQDKRIEIINMALSNKKEKVYIRNYFNENSVIVEDGDVEVNADSIKNIIYNAHIIPSFIKIDIEGYEGKLLQGSEGIFEEFNPIVAIAIYHKQEDLWKIPLYFMNRFHNNSFFIRSYMNINELIFYSIPNERLIRRDT